MQNKMECKMEELSIEITYKCPMNCLHCSSNADSNNTKEIPYSKIIEIIDRCKDKCGTKIVSLSGGEPFEHPQLWDILHHCKEIGLKTMIYSCGVEKTAYMCPDYVAKYEINAPFSRKRLIGLQRLCDKLIISMHGSPATHNKILNSGDNIFHCMTKTIHNAVRLGINTEIHFVPTKLNFKEIMIVYGICIGLKVNRMSVLRYVPQGRGLETEKNGDTLSLSKEEFMKLNEDMRILRDISSNIGNRTQFRMGIPADFTFLLDYRDGNKFAMKKKACDGGKSKILVKADGNVQVCPAWKELDHLSAGNIYYEDIAEIWQKGQTYVNFRDFESVELEEPCLSCIFLCSCVGGCTAQRILNTTQDINGMKRAPDPLCFLDLIPNIPRENRGNPLDHFGYINPIKEWEKRLFKP